MRWIRASERLPEPTNGYAKQTVTKWTFYDGSIQLRVTTINELIDATTKFLVNRQRLEWLDESETSSPDKEGVEELANSYVGSNYAKAPLQSITEANYIQGVSYHSFIAGYKAAKGNTGGEVK